MNGSRPVTVPRRIPSRTTTSFRQFVPFQPSLSPSVLKVHSLTVSSRWAIAVPSDPELVGQFMANARTDQREPHDSFSSFY